MGGPIIRWGAKRKFEPPSGEEFSKGEFISPEDGMYPGSRKIRRFCGTSLARIKAMSGEDGVELAEERKKKD